MGGDVRTQIAALDAVAKPQGWHVWLSDRPAFYATKVRPDGSAITLDADTVGDIRDQLISRGVRL